VDLVVEVVRDATVQEGDFQLLRIAETTNTGSRKGKQSMIDEKLIDE
jgi:hypothetical protein